MHGQVSLRVLKKVQPQGPVYTVSSTAPPDRDFSVQGPYNAAPAFPPHNPDRSPEHGTAICRGTRFQKAVIQTARHPTRPKAEAPDRPLETPASPSPEAVSRQFWRWFSEMALRCPEAAATSPCPFPGRLQTHRPKCGSTTIHRNPRQSHAKLPPDIQPTKSRGKYPRNSETCPAPRDVWRAPRLGAAAPCSANGCYRLLPAHFDSPALRPFPHPFSRRNRHRQRIIQREAQTSRLDRCGYSSLPLGASRAVLSRTHRSPFRKGLLLRGTERLSWHRA